MSLQSSVVQVTQGNALQVKSTKKEVPDPEALWKLFDVNSKVSDKAREDLSNDMTQMQKSIDDRNKINNDYCLNHLESGILSIPETMVQEMKDRVSRSNVYTNTLAQILKMVEEDKVTTEDLVCTMNSVHSKKMDSSKNKVNIGDIEALKFEAKARLASWKAMPVPELQERLNKGEILPSAEWMPDSGLKKPLLKMEVDAHIEWGTKLKNEGAEAYKASVDAVDNTVKEERLERAHLLYKQGIRLLENVEADSKCAEKDQLDWGIEDLLFCFLRNHAQTSIALGKYSEALDNCDAILQEKPMDIKARYRRGIARMHNSDVLGAKQDFLYLSKGAIAEENPTALAAGKHGMKLLRDMLIDWKRDARSMMMPSIEQGVFSSDRKTTTQKEDSVTRPPSTDGNKPSTGPMQVENLDMNIEALKPLSKFDYCHTVHLLVSLIDFLSRKDIANALNKIRLGSNFEPKGFIYAFRSSVRPLIEKHLFEECKTLGVTEIREIGIYENLLSTAQYHTHTDRRKLYDGPCDCDVEELYVACRQLVWGDIDEIDNS